jgi:N6-adenosine-specific RNA methylase IME4
MEELQIAPVVRMRQKRRREGAATAETVSASDTKRPWLLPSPAPSDPGWPGPPQDKDRGSAATDNPEEYRTRVPRNDYCQRFVDTGERPQNFIRDTNLLARFDEYPKLKELTKLKDERVRARSFAPLGIKADLKTFDLRSLECKFDVVLIDAPLEEYVRRSPQLVGAAKSKDDVSWTFEQIGAIPIDEIAATPSFLFLWVGDAEGLDKGRNLLAKWGYRRCEDITWIKTNRDGSRNEFHDPHSVLQHTKEHCLMGMRGTARRSTDGHLIHCNVDTDVILAEEPADGSAYGNIVTRFHVSSSSLQNMID